MACEGGGQFFDYSSGTAPDYSQITLPTTYMSFNLVDYYANNRNADWYKGVLVPDSDGYGLPDSLARQLGYIPGIQTYTGISNWTHYQVSQTLVSEGQCLKAGAACNVATQVKAVCGTMPAGGWPDTDNDGLNDCEELLVGSDPLQFDSNADMLPDGFEASKGIQFNTSAQPCWSMDEDEDGVDDCNEAKNNTPPTVANASVIDLHPYQYSFSLISESATQQCYKIQVSNVTTLSPTDTIEFMGIEQPNVFQSAFILKKASKPASQAVNGTLNFSSGDFQ